MDSGDNFYYYKFREWARDITSLASPIILIFVPFIVIGNTYNFWKLLLALLLNEVVGSLIKIFFHQSRPDGQPYRTIMEKIDAGSFPSLHASRITIVYLTMITLTSDLSISIAIGIMMLLVMISRVVLKRHYIRDILGGFSIGILFWWVFSQYIYIY